jgi:hypothetical protein
MTARKKKIELEEPVELVAGGEEREAEDEESKDIYDEDAREEMVEDDEITAAEEGFMRGREGDVEGGKKDRKVTAHKDTPSVELAKGQYGED